ncbi:ferredoxin-NADP reductase [Myxococcota bacterium]|nr:ferredoxin-NADP reductase [Myxococcota bacterium]
MRLTDYDTTDRFTARVVSTERISPPEVEEVRELVLDVGRDLAVTAGQTLGVLAPGQAEFGQAHHFRLYTVADMPERAGGRTRLRIAVRRCDYIDPYSGERYPGVASNYLCDLRAGDELTMSGPYGLAFPVPAEPDAQLVLIGMGTGIAPFRAFLRHLYNDVPSFRGRVILFHGGRTGLDLLYHNDERDDFALYQDKGTFEAIKALSPRPDWTGSIDWAEAIEPRGAELWQMMASPDTYVYLAGLQEISDRLDGVFAGLAGSPERWARRKAELRAGGRWVELLY